MGSFALPYPKAKIARVANVPMVLVIVIASVMCAVLSFVCCLFVGIRQWKNR